MNVAHWVALVLVLVVLAVVLRGMWREAFRPMDEVDEYCSRVDAELSSVPVREKPLLVALDDVDFDWPAFDAADGTR